MAVAVNADFRPRAFNRPVPASPNSSAFRSSPSSSSDGQHAADRHVSNDLILAAVAKKRPRLARSSGIFHLIGPC
jgi:hypothetical protein